MNVNDGYSYSFAINNKLKLAHHVSMSQALDTQAISGYLIDVIEHSRQFPMLISPFVRFAPVIRKSIENADSRGVNIIFVYGKTEMSSQEYLWLKTLKHIQIRYSGTLHAKFYSNEEAAVIGSMNLYDYSQINNEELGMFLFSKDKADKQSFYDLLELADRIIDRSSIEYATFEYKHSIKESFTKRLSRDVMFNVLSEPIDECRFANNSKSPEESIDRLNDVSDHCIRCGKAISNQSFYCDQCLEQWMRYKNTDYPEYYCAICGKASVTTAMKPVCKDCFSKYEGYVIRKRDYLLKVSREQLRS